MKHQFATVLKHYSPSNIRRKNMRKFCGAITLLLVFTYLTQNMVALFSPDPDHSHDLLADESTRHVRQDTHSKEIRHRKKQEIIPNHHQVMKKKQKVATTAQKPTNEGMAGTSLSKWMVVFSQKGCDVKHLTKIAGWKVIVIGKTPRGCRPPRCTYIDTTKEKRTKYTLTKLLPGNSDGRKTIGYLFAISQRAGVIYDVDCNIIPKFNKLGFKFTGNTSGLAFTGGPIFNPYAHLGYPMLYPKGFPENVQSVKGQGRYHVVDIEVPVIQQGQVNFVLGKKDVAYLNLTRTVNITFDRSSPPVYLSGRRFGPINSLNTVFLYQAFWALFIPSNPDGDTIRGYIAQRLLQEIGGSVGFVTSTAYALNSKGGKSKFVISKHSTNKFTETLITTLRNWKCVPKMSFFECAKSLIKYLGKVDFLTQKDASLFNAWITDLKKLGYREPERKTKFEASTHPGLRNPQVIYESPKVIPSEILLRKDASQSNINKQVGKAFQKICPHHKQTVAKWINPPITDIMLVVIFNYEFLFKNLPYMEFSHRPYFRHILYCGPSFKGFTKILKETNMHHLIYVDGVDSDTWFFTYQCIIHAANMNLNVKGYLYIGDDILLNTWNIVNLPRDKFWMPMPMTHVARNQTKHDWWYYWNKPVGRKAANLVLKELQELARKNPGDKMVSNFLGLYDRNVKLSMAVHRSIDVFYAPALYNDEIVRFGRIFRKHSTLLGLAVPMLHAGLVKLGDVVQLKGKSLWKDGRAKNIEAFKEDNHYLHPFKAGKDLETETGRDFFCNIFWTLSERKLETVRATVYRRNHK